MVNSKQLSEAVYGSHIAKKSKTATVNLFEIVSVFYAMKI